VEPAAYTESAINERIATLQIASDAATPAGQTLMAAAQNPALNDTSNENYVIFISDGWQYCSVDNAGTSSCALPGDCDAMGQESCNTCNACQIGDTSPACAGQNADGCYCVRSWPVLGVQALADAGIKTYVIGFGDNVDALTLNQAAQVGGDPLPDCDPNSAEQSCYLEATSPAELTAALDKIMLRVSRAPCEGSCGFTGKKTCTIEGWTECTIPEAIECTSECGTTGEQACVDGELAKCSASCEEPEGRGGNPGTGGSSAGGSSGEGAGTASGGSTTGGSGGGGGDDTTSSGSGSTPPPGDDWDDGDDWGDDDWEKPGDLPQGVPEPPSGDPEAASSCAYAPQPSRTQPSGNSSAWWLAALGLAFTRRRRR
jgi:MYXO-CTERM domain-containing protein